MAELGHFKTPDFQTIIPAKLENHVPLETSKNIHEFLLHGTSFHVILSDMALGDGILASGAFWGFVALKQQAGNTNPVHLYSPAKHMALYRHFTQHPEITSVRPIAEPMGITVA